MAYGRRGEGLSSEGEPERMRFAGGDQAVHKAKLAAKGKLGILRIGSYQLLAMRLCPQSFVSFEN
jgi:hypothetical protein